MRNLFFTVLMVCAAPLAAFAAEKPPELAGSIQATAPVGESKFRKLMLHVYDAAFWSDSGGWKQAPYALSITYAMDFSPDELADRTLDEMQHVSSAPAETLHGYAEQLRKIYPPVHDGDRITALQKDPATTQFYYNGKPVGQVKDAKFAAAFFGIWLSPKSSEPEMRRALLHESTN